MTNIYLGPQYATFLIKSQFEMLKTVHVIAVAYLITDN